MLGAAVAQLRLALALLAGRPGPDWVVMETIPFGGTVSKAGRLHVPVDQGLAEVLDPDGGEPVAPGETGALVAPPFAPSATPRRSCATTPRTWSRRSANRQRAASGRCRPPATSWESSGSPTATTAAGPPRARC